MDIDASYCYVHDSLRSSRWVFLRCCSFFPCGSDHLYLFKSYSLLFEFRGKRGAGFLASNRYTKFHNCVSGCKF